MRKMPIGIQTFEDIITNDYVYVDKTAYAYKLAREGKVYFLGRPRRFGKSLLLSTLEAYFLGRKELFEGLAIGRLEQDWETHPVFHIDLTGSEYKKEDDLKTVLNSLLRRYEEEWGIVPEDDAPSLRFENLLRQTSEKSGRRVVVLIDEYDKPLLENMEDIALNDGYRDTLRAFYGVLKKSDPYLRFALLTGVTRFSKVSVFSDLNQLQDISMRKDYSGICGISYQELIDSFDTELHELAERNGLTYEEATREMAKRYDGYHFSEDSDGIFNPFSVLNTFASGKFLYYWFKTGTPTFLIKLLRDARFDVMQFQEGIKIPLASIDDYRIGGDNPVPLLYQSGYLTIKGYEALTERYILGFPNEEVEYGFLNELLPRYAVPQGSGNDFFAANFIDDLLAGNMDSFMTRLKAFFAGIPYELNDKTERHYQVVFYLLFTLMGQFVQAEVHSAKGSSDAVVALDDAVYIFEFKLLKDDKGRTAADALAQIDEKGYALPYAAGGKKLVKVGVQFDAEERNIGEWQVATA